MSSNRLYLTENEYERLFKAIDKVRDFLIFSLIGECGMRPGEIGRNSCRDIPPLLVRSIEDVLLGRGNLIHLERAKRHPNGRDVILVNPIVISEFRRFFWPGVEEPTEEEFEEHITELRNEPVFMTQVNTGISVRQIRLLFKKYALKAGLPPNKQHPYILRHTMAVMALKSKKVSIETIRQALGHSNIKTTSIYVAMVMDDAVEEMKKLYEE